MPDRGSTHDGGSDRGTPAVGVIDAHFHVWGTPFPGRPFPWTPDPFDVTSMTEVFDTHGIVGGIDVTPIMYGWDNSYAVSAAATTAGRIAAFGRFDALAPDPGRRLSTWLETPGAAGVRLTFYGAGLDDLREPDRLEPFWAAAEELGVRVAVFAPDALWSIVDVAERHPSLRLVIDHLGLGVYPGCEDPRKHQHALVRFAPFPQILVKISGAVEVSTEHYPFRDMHDVVHEAREAFGPDRLMWGSNFPVAMSECTYQQALDFVDECGFTGDDRDAVLAGTATAMLAERGIAITNGARDE